MLLCSVNKVLTGGSSDPVVVGVQVSEETPERSANRSQRGRFKLESLIRKTERHFNYLLEEMVEKKLLYESLLVLIENVQNITVYSHTPLGTFRDYYIMTLTNLHILEEALVSRKSLPTAL